MAETTTCGRATTMANAAAGRTVFVFAPGIGLVSDDVDGASFASSPRRPLSRSTRDGSSDVTTVVLPPTVGKDVGSGKYGSFTWPSAVVLAQAVWYNADAWVRGKAVLELGAGTALPGILAGLLGAHRVHLTDASDATGVLETCRAACTANGLHEPVVTVSPLDWGHFPAEFFELPEFNTVLGADVFYEPSEFEDCVATVGALLRRVKSKDARFVTTYQDRAADATLAPYLDRHGLRATEIPLRDVFPAEARDDADAENVTVHLLVITLLDSDSVSFT